MGAAVMDDIGGGDGDWRQTGVPPLSYVLEGPVVAVPFCVDGWACSIIML